MNKPAKTHTVIVEPDGGGGFIAGPSPLVIKKSDKVKFYNKTPGEIKIQFSQHSAFIPPWLHVDPGEQETVTATEPEDLVTCPYAVWCTAPPPGRFAHGSAMPIIIIDPKD